MSARSARLTGRSLTTATLLVAAGLAAAGCSEVDSTGDKGYISGKGVITVLPADERKPVGDVAGETLDGAEVSLASYAGKVVVVNVWGAWCPPCRAEADDLAEAARELAPQGVEFLGINTRDASEDTARAFERRYNVPYPSIYDFGGRNLLAFRGTLTPNSIPSTVVIDAEGRVAASILGEVTTSTTLVDVVDEVTK